METVRLGRQGLRGSRLCLGTMVFGAQCDEKPSFAVLDGAAEPGATFLDPAAVAPSPPSRAPARAAARLAPRPRLAAGAARLAAPATWVAGAGRVGRAAVPRDQPARVVGQKNRRSPSRAGHLVGRVHMFQIIFDAHPLESIGRIDPRAATVG